MLLHLPAQDAPHLRALDTLCGLFVIVRLGEEDVGHKSLRIAVVEREPAGLHLNHYAVSGPENVICGGKGELVKQRYIGWDGGLASAFTAGRPGLELFPLIGASDESVDICPSNWLHVAMIVGITRDLRSRSLCDAELRQHKSVVAIALSYPVVASARPAVPSMKVGEEYERVLVSLQCS